MNGIDVNGVLVLVIRCSFVSLFKQDSIGVEKEKNDLKANVSEREEEEIPLVEEEEGEGADRIQGGDEGEEDEGADDEEEEEEDPEKIYIKVNLSSRQRIPLVPF